MVFAHPKRPNVKVNRSDQKVEPPNLWKNIRMAHSEKDFLSTLCSLRYAIRSPCKARNLLLLELQQFSSLLAELGTYLANDPYLTEC